jgi:hypothetical protein
VRDYASVFWERYTELNDYEKYMKNIERGEQKIQRYNDIMDALAMKLEAYKNPWKDLKVRETSVRVRRCRTAEGEIMGAAVTPTQPAAGFWP